MTAAPYSLDVFSAYTARRLLRRACLVLATLGTLLSYGAARADELVVSAAASLTNAFKDVAIGFERQHPGTRVMLNFGASDLLMRQIANGAPADVFASADQTAMNEAVKAGVVDASTRKNFAANSLVLIVPADSRTVIASVRQLGKMTAIRRIALADPASVPAGRYAQSAIEAEDAQAWRDIRAKAVLAGNVRQCLDYVARGEVDAGFVFGTDAAVAPQPVKVAATVPTPQPISYPIAVVKPSGHAAQAQAFVDYVLSPAGQAVLGRYGFKSAAAR